MRKVGWVVSMIWLQYAYVITLDHCPLYIDLLDPLHIYLIHFNMYQQTHLAGQMFESCNDCQISILQCTYKSSGVYGMDRDDTIENYHDFSVIFAIELMELFSKQ